MTFSRQQPLPGIPKRLKYECSKPNCTWTRTSNYPPICPTHGVKAKVRKPIITPEQRQVAETNIISIKEYLNDQSIR